MPAAGTESVNFQERFANYLQSVLLEAGATMVSMAVEPEPAHCALPVTSAHSPGEQGVQLKVQEYDTLSQESVSRPSLV